MRASLWEVWPIPRGMCEEHPELQKYGLYRKLNTGKWEFVSYCLLSSPAFEGHQFFAVYDDDLNAMIDKYVPKGKK